MYCGNCGKELPIGSLFCPKCGADVTDSLVRCPVCGAEQTATSDFCSICGKSIKPADVTVETLGSPLSFLGVPGSLDEILFRFRQKQWERSPVGSQSWRRLNSFWLLFLIIPLFVGLVFIYIGTRARYKRWIYWGVFSTIFLCIFPILITIFPDTPTGDTLRNYVILLPFVVVWLGSIIYGIVINKKYLSLLSNRLIDERQRAQALISVIGPEPRFQDLALSETVPRKPILEKSKKIPGISGFRPTQKEKAAVRLLEGSQIEPQVVRSAALYKNKLALNKIIILAPLITLVLIFIFLFAYLLHYGSKAAPKAVRHTFTHNWPHLLTNTILPIIGVYLVCLILFAVITVIRRRYFQSAIWSNVVPDSAEAQGFKDTLETVSLAHGSAPPPVAVLETDYVGAEPFMLRRNRPVVAVTAGLLETPLSSSEKEAVAAHQLAHVAIGDVAKAPSFWDLRHMAIALIWTYLALGACVFGLIDGLMNAPGTKNFILMWSVIVLVFVGLLAALFYRSAFLFERFAMISRDGELLADSIAAKIIEDPGALKSAIMKLNAPKAIKKLATMPDRIPVIGPNEKEISIRTLELCTHESITAERLRNLDAIEMGHWPILEGQ